MAPKAGSTLKRRKITTTRTEKTTDIKIGDEGALEPTITKTTTTKVTKTFKMEAVDAAAPAVPEDNCVDPDHSRHNGDESDRAATPTDTPTDASQHP